eukprot:1853334-Lingulodinium_polyedra.AAC.1
MQGPLGCFFGCPIRGVPCGWGPGCNGLHLQTDVLQGALLTQSAGARSEDTVRDLPSRLAIRALS